MRDRAASRFWLALLISAASFGQTGAVLQDPAVTGLLPPDAGMLLGIEWRKILATATGETLQKQIRETRVPGIPGLAGVQAALLEQVDSIVLAAPAGELGRAGQDTPMLVIVRGRFEPGSMETWFAGPKERIGDVELRSAGGSSRPSGTRLAILDAGTLLFGDRRELVAAIRRRSAPSRAPNSLLARAMSLAPDHEFWIALQAPAGGFLPSKSAAGKEALTPQAQVLADLAGLDLALSFQGGFGLQANLQAKSEEAARNLGMMAQGLTAMAAMSNTENPEAAEMLRKLQIVPAGRTVQISLHLTEAEAARAMAQLQAARYNAGRTALDRPAAPPAEPRRAQPGKIRIVGAEVETEVPVKSAR